MLLWVIISVEKAYVPLLALRRRMGRKYSGGGENTRERGNTREGGHEEELLRMYLGWRKKYFEK